MMKNKSQAEPRSPGIPFFENLPELLRPERAATVLDVSIKTIYDWRYKHRRYKVPGDLFLKFNRILYLNTKVLKEWIASQNPSVF